MRGVVAAPMRPLEACRLDPHLLAVEQALDAGLAGFGTRMLPAAKATVSYINDYMGGLAGRPIDLVGCETAGDPGKATDCANQLVQDDVAMVIMPETQQPLAVHTVTACPRRASSARRWPTSSLSAGWTLFGSPTSIVIAIPVCGSLRAMNWASRVHGQPLSATGPGSL